MLETERLILRPPGPEDFDAFAAFSADDVAMRHMGGTASREIAWRGCAMIIGAWTLCGFSMFSAIEKATGRWVGRLGPWAPEGWPGPEVGWGLAREFWGKGYATEGATAAMDWVFDELGWTEVIHPIVPENTPSQAVARRLGSSVLRRGALPINAVVVDIWGQTRDQWRRRSKP